MSRASAKTTLGPGLRRGDGAVSTQGAGIPEYVDAASASSRRTPGSSVVRIIATCMLFCTPPAMAQDWISLEKGSGTALFTEKCGMCHRATGMGTGILARRMSAELALLENRTDLQPDFITTVVRNGFGTMFPLSRAEVSDAQLQALVDYLTQEDGAQ